VICEICSAPALRLEDACVFCRSPLDEARASDADLLDYLGERVPRARARRGLFGRGQVSRFSVEAGGESFSARLRQERLDLRPELSTELWVDRLLAGLSRDAAAEPEVREAVSRSGWRLR
jgi:hypothetical protein